MIFIPVNKKPFLFPSLPHTCLQSLSYHFRGEWKGPFQELFLFPLGRYWEVWGTAPCLYLCMSEKVCHTHRRRRGLHNGTTDLGTRELLSIVIRNVSLIMRRLSMVSIPRGCLSQLVTLPWNPNSTVSWQGVTDWNWWRRRLNAKQPGS